MNKKAIQEMETVHYDLSNESTSRLFDLISNFYSLVDNGYKPSETVRNKVLTTCAILTNRKFNVDKVVQDVRESVK